MTIWYRHLSVLSRAVHFQNLTAASQHVGLSQPQLSRLIGQLEEGLGVVLLDRGVRRKTNWTSLAHRLAQLFDHTEHRMARSMQEMLSGAIVRELKAACLEGLVDLAVQQMGRLVKHPHWRLIHLDVLDQTELEERFLSGAVDVVWTSRVPGKGKARHQVELGYQTLDERKSGAHVQLLSRYEFGQSRKPLARHASPDKRQTREPLTIVSNSLRVRETWFSKIGGHGLFPSAVGKERARGQLPVLLLGSSLLPEIVWQELVESVVK
ncbi:MAG: LysR family transcriptional regulator [Bdellovibrionales bacterium]